MTTIFLNITLILLLVLTLSRYIVKLLPQWLFYLILSLKILSGIALGMLYQHYYAGGDTYSLFERAVQFNASAISFSDYLSKLWLEPISGLTLQPRVVFFIKILSPIVALTNDTYWLTSIYISLISFIGFWILIETLSEKYPNSRSWAVICFGFLPSVVFWSSGILKDSIANSALCLAAACLLSILKENPRPWGKIVVFLITFVVVLKLKHYLGIVLLIIGIPAFSWSVLERFKFNKKFKITLITGIGICAALLASSIHPYLTFNRLPLSIYENYQLLVAEVDTSKVIMYNLEPSWMSIIINGPKALFNGLFAPTIWGRPYSIITLPSRIENLAYLALTCFGVYQLIKKRKTLSVDSTTIFTVFGIILLSTFIALSTPNIGTLIRYKTAYLPFFLYLATHKVRFPVFRR
ncbi:MAG: hypothetical protein KI790_04520 [Cyclobacteriaceae bacterium]|nr:hypothetical protein [Cyclobacteriaceae bacterium HetDA_MAG_MS6]